MYAIRSYYVVHDDVIDAAPERRGKPTAAALFNNASSVMLGDYMFAHAAEFVARTGNIRVIRNFRITSYNVCYTKLLRSRKQEAAINTDARRRS